MKASEFAELLNPAVWCEVVEATDALVETCETHISHLYFVGEKVFKVKKPVNLGFLDFSTLAARHSACVAELRLNARLAADWYLGLVPLLRAATGNLVAGRLIPRSEAAATLDSDDSPVPVEWAVCMRRLPAQRMFDAMLERGDIDNSQLAALAARLVQFHESAARSPEVDAYGAPHAVTRNALDNLDELRPIVCGLVADEAGRSDVRAGVEYLSERSERFTSRRRALLEERVQNRRIVDGHGDLHAGNICFPTSSSGEPHEPVAYDCIEFSQRFRCGDVAADIAFLCMDLDFRGYHAFGEWFARRYAELAEDKRLGELLPFYKGYRALVRAKVAGMLAADEAAPPDLRAEKSSESLRYLALALRYELPPFLILTAGLPASGKSYLAAALARATGARLLVSDVQRKALVQRGVLSGSTTEVDSGLYTPVMRQAVYDRLRAQARETLLDGGRAVIVDASFGRAADRGAFLELAHNRDLPAIVIHVTCDEAEVQRRLSVRAIEGSSSDADEAVRRTMSARFEPVVEVRAAELLEIASGTRPTEIDVLAVLHYLCAK